jgi:long-chain acyl-CoA synthetase
MTAVDYSIADIFARSARLHRDRIALVCESTRQTFGELDADAARLAGRLASAGVRSGDRIAILARSCHRYLALVGATAKLAAIAVPLNLRLSAAELTALVGDSEPRVIVASDDALALVAEVLAPLPVPPTILVLGRGRDNHAGTDDDERPGPRTAAPAEPGMDDVLALVYTAAVEGQPRGAMLTHGNVVAANAQALLGFGLDHHTVQLLAVPFFHVTGLGLALAVLHAGGRTVVLPRFDPAAALDLVETERCTFLAEFAPMLGRLLEEQRRKPRDLGSLVAITGLDRPDVIREGQALTGARFFAVFGQTETTGLVTIAPFDERPGSAGREGPLARVRIVDEAGRECAGREVGEIVVSSPMVCRGYWRQPDATAYARRTGAHHTGDLGYIDEDGYLWYVERKADKELIKPGGENVYPAEVERVIAAHPAVHEVAVIGVPDAEWGEAVKAVCVLAPGAHVDAEEIVEFVRQRIASYKKPKHVTFVTSLPRTPDGRVDRARVKALHGGS